MLPIKKSLQHPKSDQEKRTAFCQQIQEYQANNRPLVYLDESGFAHDMPRTYGYAVRGERCYGKHDWGAKGRTNVIGALLGKLLLTFRLFANSINTSIFTTWIEEELIPKLPPCSVIIMGNASFHKGLEMQQAIEAAGHTLVYLPLYTPDLNKIEKKWAQAKSLRRKYQYTIESLFLDLNL